MDIGMHNVERKRERERERARQIVMDAMRYLKMVLQGRRIAPINRGGEEADVATKGRRNRGKSPVTGKSKSSNTISAASPSLHQDSPRVSRRSYDSPKLVSLPNL